MKQSLLRQDELHMREREYGHRILQLRVEEFATLCRDRRRLERFKSALRSDADEGDRMEEVEMEEPASPRSRRSGAMTDDESLADQAQKTLADVQAEFDDFFNRRQQKLEEALRGAQTKMAEKQAIDNEIHQGMLQMLELRTTDAHEREATRAVGIQVCAQPGRSELHSQPSSPRSPPRATAPDPFQH